MNAARHRRIKDVFLAVQALPPSEWEAALERACDGDVDLREEVASLLSHHRSQSLMGAPPDAAPGRVVAINVAQEASAEWKEEQRQLLQRRLRLWIPILCLTSAVALVRAFGIIGGASGFAVGAELAGLVGGGLGLFGVSLWLLLLRAPSYALLRRFEIALSLAGAVVFFSWGHLWLTRGVAVTARSSAQLGEIFQHVYWVVSPDNIAYLQVPRALIGGHLTILWCSYGVFYSFIVPNTRRRGAVMIAASELVVSTMFLSASVANSMLRPYLVQTLLFSLLVIGVFSSAALYMALQFATLRRAVFEARQVGQYRLVRPLGAGAMGEVHLAQHHLLRRPCAIKLIRPEFAGSHDGLVRFEREVQAMSQLTHPNTVEVYDFGRTEDGSFFYAMEYLPGMTLDAVVRAHGPMPPGRVVYLMLQVCGALAEAHEKGLVHRDVKPGNIFASERGGQQDFIKLLDFGLVHGLNDAPELPGGRASGDADVSITQAGQLLGTPTFMSPDQIRGESLDARSDIYSLGGVAYFLLTGRPPFERETLAELFEAHLHEPVRGLRDDHPGGPSDLEAIILRCLAKDRDARFHRALDVAAALRETAVAGAWDSSQAEVWWREHPVSVEAGTAPDLSSVASKAPPRTVGTRRSFGLAIFLCGLRGRFPRIGV